jgi:DNA repair protein RadC
MTIKLSRSQKIKVITANDMFPIMRDILLHENKIDRDKEHFWLVCLSNNNTILMIELISLGSVNMAIVEPMDVFSFALQKRAVKLIMVHNHPSGEMRPSLSDIELTERMYAIGRFIRVPVIEHLIISEKTFFSFMEAGIMDRIRVENKYDLTFAEMDKVTAALKKAEQEREKSEKEKKAALKKVAIFEKEKIKEIATAEKQKAKEIAQNLLVKGVAIDIIVSASGLTKKEIEGLKKR